VGLRFFAGFVGFCLVCGLTLGGLGLWWVDSLMKKMLDPRYVTEIAQGLATYEKPLWPKYQPLMGLALGADVKLVSLGLSDSAGPAAEGKTAGGENGTSPEKAAGVTGKGMAKVPCERFFLVLLKPAREISSKELLHNLMAFGEFSPEGVVTLGKVEERGQDQVRLGTVDFIKAEGRDSLGAVYKGYVACLSHKGKMLGLVAVHPGSMGSDFPKAHEFLENLQAF
jgi:hypothetical protein